MPFTYAPALADNAADTVVAPHAVALVAFCFNVPALQYVLAAVAARVWLHWVYVVHPVPPLRVHPDVCAGQLF